MPISPDHLARQAEHAHALGQDQRADHHDAQRGEHSHAVPECPHEPAQGEIAPGEADYDRGDHAQRRRLRGRRDAETDRAEHGEDEDHDRPDLQEAEHDLPDRHPGRIDRGDRGVTLGEQTDHRHEGERDQQAWNNSGGEQLADGDTLGRAIEQQGQARGNEQAQRPACSERADHVLGR